MVVLSFRQSSPGYETSLPPMRDYRSVSVHSAEFIGKRGQVSLSYRAKTGLLADYDEKTTYLTKFGQHSPSYPTIYCNKTAILSCETAQIGLLRKELLSTADIFYRIRV